MKNNIYKFLKRLLSLVLMVLSCSSIYSQGAAFKAIGKATKAMKVATKSARKIEYNSNKIGREYVMREDGSLHRIQPTTQIRTTTPVNTQNKRNYSYSKGRSSSNRVMPAIAASRKAVMKTCPACNGTGRNNYGKQCPLCNGKGRLSLAKSATYKIRGHSYKR